MPRRPDFVPPDTSRNNTTYDTDLTDAQWALIAPFLPPPDTSGAPRTTNMRHAVNVMLYRLKTGCPWKMVPKDFGIPWKTVYNWHEAFARLGKWERVQRALAATVRVADGSSSLSSFDQATRSPASSGHSSGVGLRRHGQAPLAEEGDGVGEGCGE